MSCALGRSHIYQLHYYHTILFDPLHSPTIASQMGIKDTATEKEPQRQLSDHGGNFRQKRAVIHMYGLTQSTRRSHERPLLGRVLAVVTRKVFLTSLLMNRNVFRGAHENTFANVNKDGGEGS